MNFASEIPMQLRDMSRQLGKMQKLLKKRLKAAENSGDTDAVSQLNGEVTKLAVSMASLGRELRSWEGKVRKSVQSMSNEDRIKVIVRFLEELPPGERVMFAEATRASRNLESLWTNEVGT